MTEYELITKKINDKIVSEYIKSVEDKILRKVHKTPELDVPPLIYLPLSYTPIVGNYLEPTKLANGKYYVEQFGGVYLDNYDTYHVPFTMDRA